MSVYPIAIDAPGAISADEVHASFESVLARVHADYGRRTDSVHRYRRDHFMRLERKVREAGRNDPRVIKRLDSIGAMQQGRQDSFGADGFHLTRELEFIHGEVLRQVNPDLNGLTLFGSESSPPVGARSHTVRRITTQGEARLYRAGTDVPQVSVAKAEESWPVHHIVTGFNVDIFDMAASDFANSGLVRELVETAKEAIDQFRNRLVFYGETSANIYGITNNPYLPSPISAVPINSSSAADAIIAEMNRLANWNNENSLQRFSPSQLVTTPKVRNYLYNTPRSTTTDTSIGKWFTGNNAHINDIQEAWELQGVGPGGTDGAFFFRPDRSSLRVHFPQGFTMLPVQREGFVERVYCYASFAGVVMPNMHNLLAWVTPPS